MRTGPAALSLFVPRFRAWAVGHVIQNALHAPRFLQGLRSAGVDGTAKVHHALALHVVMHWF